MLRSITLGLGLLLAVAAGPAGAADRWIHVAVDGTEDDAERVRVNVPLELVETVLPLLQDHEICGEDILDDSDLSKEELVTILKAVKDAKDGEYVTVEDGEDHVRVMKQDGHLFVKVEEGEGEDQERVEVRFPMDVLDALLAGEGDDIDIAAAVRALGEHGDGNLVEVHDSDGTQVRVWIDSQNVSD